MYEKFDLNLNIFYFLNSLVNNYPFLNKIFIFLGEYLIYLLIILFFFYFSKKIWADKKIELYEIILYFSVSVFAWLIAKIIKISLPTLRPFADLNDVNLLIKNENIWSSFPSGHSTLSFALAFSLYFYNKKIGIIALFMAFLVALGRVFIGVHYPLDIVTGSLIGFLIVYLFNKFWMKKILKKNKK